MKVFVALSSSVFLLTLEVYRVSVLVSLKLLVFGALRPRLLFLYWLVSKAWWLQLGYRIWFVAWVFGQL